MGNIYEEKLGTAPIVPLVFKMALPAVAAQLVNLLYSIVDRIYIGHIPGIGTDALAGVGVTGSVILLLSAFSSIVSGGGAPLASIALGRGEREKAQKYLGNGFVLLLAFSVLLTVLIYLFMEPVLLFVGASANTLGYAVEYLSVYLTGTLFVQLATGLNTFISVQGRPGISMLSVVIGAFLNIVFDPLFIFVFGMNVKGAALATVISQAFSAVWVAGFLVSEHASLRIQKKYLRPDKKILFSMLALGISPFVMASTESLVGIVLNSSLKSFGDIYVSTLTVMQSAMQFSSVPLTGFAQGFVPIVSYNYGHGNLKRVKDCFKLSLSVMFSFNLLLMLLMILFPAIVADMFTDDSLLIQQVRYFMPIFLAGMTIFGLQRACQNMFVALGRAKTSLFIALLRKVILLVPLALLLPHFMGVTGIFAAEAISDATAAICCTFIFWITSRKLFASAKDN